jgi:spore maturation protein CgeB
VRIFAIGSSIVSSYWNGAATYYRGIYKNLHALGHEVTFAEPDIYGRQQKRDNGDYSYVDSLVYQSPHDIDDVLRRAWEADLVIKHSGVGADDDTLEQRVLECRSPHAEVAFWDVDAPATLARVEQNPGDPFRPLIAEYDYIFTYGGGPPVIEHYLRMGAQSCHPVYNAVDCATHFPVPPQPQFACDLAFVGHRLPDREARVEEFFLRSAHLAPEMTFLLGGEGWAGKPLPSNVRWIGHVGSGDHNVVNCSARMVLNVNRESMASVGYSPPTRVFEAAGAGACVITDAWQGVETFFEPEREILIAGCAEDVVHWLRSVGRAEASGVGEAMRARALRDHDYAGRARQVHAILRRERVEAAA